MSKRVEKLLTRLNRKAIFVHFEDYPYFFNDGYEAASAMYFGVEIIVTFPNTPAEIERNQEGSEDYCIQLDLEQWTGEKESPFELWDKEAFNFKHAVQIINDYIQSRPFILIKKRGGQYDLLDPNGKPFQVDIDLKQAKQLSAKNLKIVAHHPT